MRSLVCAVLLLVASCGKESNQKPDEKKPEATAKASDEKPADKMSDKTAADIVAQTIAAGKGSASPTPPTPTPPPVDPMPPEVKPTTIDPATPPTPPTPPPPPSVTPPPTPPVPVTTPPPADELKVGDRVMAQWTNGSWYPGKIVGIKDGKFDINYDDGDKSRGLAASKVKKPKKSGGSVAGKSSGTSSDAPCPGPGLTRRCNGKCVNIQEDNNHCGSCNNRCPSGKHCDGHMFCRDADGNL